MFDLRLSACFPDLFHLPLCVESTRQGSLGGCCKASRLIRGSKGLLRQHLTIPCVHDFSMRAPSIILGF